MPTDPLTPEPRPVEPAARARPRFSTALLVSVVLNVLLGAVLAGGIWNQVQRAGQRGAPFRMPIPGMLERALPEADKPILRRTFAPHRRVIRQRGVALRAARREVRDAIAAEPFNRARLDTALATMRLHESEMTMRVHGVLAEVAQEISPEGRRVLTEVTLRRERAWRGRRAAGGRDPGLPRDESR